MQTSEILAILRSLGYEFSSGEEIEEELEIANAVLKAYKERTQRNAERIINLLMNADQARIDAVLTALET
jgi:hypothetical protein